jgi:asparagine synthase (glutamine-hydrolysing)
MCGIAGFVSLTGQPAEQARVDAMIDTLEHRGPDDTGVFTSGPAGIGAARLSIIDVAGGHQPISTDAGAITVAQNGEIYNYVELAREIELAGRRMTTMCDTEVIAHLYAMHGVAAFSRMRGMFAVAIWDAPRRRLILARDRVGKKPLYVMRRDGEVVFGSEVKAILAATRTTPSVNPHALLQFFTFGYTAGRDAIFDGMQRLEPGTTLAIDQATGRERVDRFWSWPESPVTTNVSEAEAIDALRHELTEAVRLRMRSDVPLGAFLSGGMDSAAVLALMTQLSPQPVKTFTIGFGDPAYDELAEARQTAAHFGAEHHEQVVTADGIGVSEALARHYDEPFADASAIPSFYVAALARKHVTVCLTGDGGDELFAGYTPYADALARAGSPAEALWRSVVRAGAKLVPVHARGKGRLSTMALGPESWFVWRRTVFPTYLLEAVIAPEVLAAATALPEDAAVDALRRDEQPLLARLQRWDQGHYLPDDILVKVDRATMAHSLEARCPILDHRVIELAASQPSSRHGSAHDTKRLFREVIRPWVPADVLTRPKRGFGVPLRRWFQEGLIGWAREILLDPRSQQRGWTRPPQVGAMLEQHAAGQRDHAKRLWALISLELWARRYLDGQLPGLKPGPSGYRAEGSGPSRGIARPA